MPRWGERTEKAQCSVDPCDRPALAKGLCRLHYTRQRNGRPLTDPEQPPVGSSSGHGQWGVLDDDGDSVLCHECGDRFQSVGAHVGRTHEMTAREYRRAHGIPAGVSLQSAALTRQQSEAAASRVGTAGWARFEQRRDPAAASHARGPEAFERRGPVAEAARHRAVENGRRARRAVVRSCAICATEWCALPGGYSLATCSDECSRAWTAVLATRLETPNVRRNEEIRADHAAGVPVRTLADRHAVTPERIRQILRE